MRKCPDCPKTVRKYGQPTILSPDSNILDQIVVCACGWCGVDSTLLSKKEAEEFRAKPRQPELFKLA